MNLNLSHLNQQQFKAVTSRNPQILVVAGPGSGKTRVLTYRIASLIEEGIDPGQIIGLTFTNKAGAEIKQRTKQLTKSSLDGIFLGTFHSFGVYFLRQEIENLNLGLTRHFTILDSGDQERLAKRILDGLGLDKALFKRLLKIWEYGKVSGVDYETVFTDYRNKDLDTEKCIKFFEELKKETVRSNSLDFNDLLLLTSKGLSDPGINRKWRERVQHLLVDEWQDTNFLQYEMVHHIAKESIDHTVNFFAVGDPDQAIYGWRGADPNNLFKLKGDFRKLEIIELNENYRSTGKILKLANKILRYSVFENRELESKAPGIHEVQFSEFLNPEMEADFTAKKCSDLVRRGDVKKFSDIAVLFRTNFQTRVLEEAFIRQNIPYKIVKGLKFFDRAEIKDTLAYIRFLQNPKDNMSFERMVSTPPRGIGDKSLSFFLEFGSGSYIDAINDFDNFIHRSRSSIGKFLGEVLDPLMKLRESAPLSQIIQRTVELTDYYGYIQKIAKSKEEILARRGNVEELIRFSTRFENLEDPMGVFLESIGLNDSKDSEEDEQENAVQFMTLHTSKGLEFESVFLISVNEEIVPHKNSILEDRIDEERRLFFVGVTRAKRILSVSFTNRTFSGLSFPSRFLKEVGALEQIKSSNRYGKQIAYQDNSHLPEDSIAYKLENNEYEPETSFDLTVGDLVKHDKFGRGVVKEVKPSGIVKVGFSEGDRVLSLAFAKLERLIDAA